MEETKKSKEIDIIGTLKKLVPHRRYLIKVAFIAAAIGVFVALNTPRQYSTEVILAPEMSGGGLGLSESLTDMAASFGIELGSKSQLDAIYPEIYPEIFASTDFVVSLFDIPVTQKKDSVAKPYRQHLIVDGMTPLWNYPIEWITSLFKKHEKNASDTIDRFHLSRDEEMICKMIKGNISCQIDKKTSIITIRVTDEDPQVAAIMADTLMHRLQDYITSYRTQKAYNDLAYYEALSAESKAEYQEIQKRFAAYSDSHMNASLQQQVVRIDEMENEMQIKYQAYAQLEQQVRAAKARIQERTPSFTIIQNATVSNRPSGTPRSLIVVSYTFLGLVVGCLWVLYGSALWHSYRNRKKQK